LQRTTADVPPAGGSARTSSASEADSSGQIKRAALRAFCEHGYHGASVREIAAGAGLSVPGLYHHFPAKEDLLFELISRTMDDLISDTEAALVTSDGDPRAQLRAVVRAHVLFHTDRREESFVGNTELRSLDSGRHSVIVEKRDHQQRLFDRVVVAGAEQGVFATQHPKEASRAIVTMCTAVASWYRKSGPLTPVAIADTYGDLALSTVGCRSADRPEALDDERTEEP
jgi:AcrR family transcriptional regulator